MASIRPARYFIGPIHSAGQGGSDRRSDPNAAYAVNLSSGVDPMLDVVFLVVGALFLGACVLYALACEQL
jgi:hypothetical protein